MPAGARRRSGSDSAKRRTWSTSISATLNPREEEASVAEVVDAAGTAAEVEAAEAAASSAVVATAFAATASVVGVAADVKADVTAVPSTSRTKTLSPA